MMTQKLSNRKYRIKISMILKTMRLQLLLFFLDVFSFISGLHGKFFEAPFCKTLFFYFCFVLFSLRLFLIAQFVCFCVF